MKIELLVSRAGPDISQSRGDVIDVSDAEGARMLAAGQAIAARAAPREITARKPRTEKAAK
jgi:hypothetical protein